MRGRRSALLPAAGAILGLAASPAAGAASGEFGQICTSGGAVPSNAPGQDRSQQAAGCAHVVCPRGLVPAKRRAARG